jgi:hypothetical protein
VGWLWHGSDLTRNKASRLSNRNVLKGENLMKKKVLAFLLVLLLVALTSQAAFADPPPGNPDNLGACNMVNSWWPDDTGPGNANGVEDGERGMFHVHNSLPHGDPLGGAIMFDLTAAHCG